MAAFDLGYTPSRHHSQRPGYDGTSLQAFFAAFPDDDTCLAHVFNRRFGPNPVCPRCGKTDRWRRHDVQKHYFHPCGGILSPMAGTVFSGSHIPLQLWFYAMLHFANSPEGISSPFLARQLGVSEQTAYRVCHRIRLHMAAIDEGKVIGKAGETVMARLSKVLRISNKRRNLQNSAMVLLLSDAAWVNSTVIVQPRQKSLRSVIHDKVHRHACLATDCYWTFRILSNYSSGQPIAKYVPEQFMDGASPENLNHGFLQYFNLSFSDQYRGVSLQNAWLFFKEYEFRYNRRAQSSCTFWDMASNFPSFDALSLARRKAINFVDVSAKLR